MIYLDHAATTPLLPEVRAEIEPYLGEDFGNPSSRHRLGVRAQRKLEEVREGVARALLGQPDGVVFTSGGTEANNLGVLGGARMRRKHGRHVLLGPTEHSSVGACGAVLARDGFEVETLKLAPGGALDLDDLRAKLRPETVLVAQMLVSNELGSRYPIEEVARAVRRTSPRAHLHVDAIQAVGKVDVSFEGLGADSMAVSAHKLGGLKGAGALLVGERCTLDPLLVGGGQENKLRSGTENVVGITSLGKALELAVRRLEGSREHLMARRGELAREVASIDGVALLDVDGGAGFSPAIAALRVPGSPGEVWLHHLEEHGVYTSVGSACSARQGSVPPAYRALGLSNDDAKRVLRLSFARSTSADDVRAAGEALRAVASELTSKL